MELLMRWEEEVLEKLKCYGFFENFCSESFSVPIQNQLRDVLQTKEAFGSHKGGKSIWGFYPEFYILT